MTYRALGTATDPPFSTILWPQTHLYIRPVSIQNLDKMRRVVWHRVAQTVLPQRLHYWWWPQKGVVLLWKETCWFTPANCITSNPYTTFRRSKSNVFVQDLQMVFVQHLFIHVPFTNRIRWGLKNSEIPNYKLFIKPTLARNTVTLALKRFVKTESLAFP